MNFKRIFLLVNGFRSRLFMSNYKLRLSYRLIFLSTTVIFDKYYAKLAFLANLITRGILWPWPTNKLTILIINLSKYHFQGYSTKCMLNIPLMRYLLKITNVWYRNKINHLKPWYLLTICYFNRLTSYSLLA